MITSEEVTYRAGNFQLTHPTVIRFCNKYYKCDADPGDSLHINDRAVTSDLQGRLYNVIAIKVGILAMLRGSVPSIARLEIWGLPSNLCEKSLARTWTNKWNEHKLKVSSASKEIETEQNTAPPTGSVATGSIRSSTEHVFPNEFIDPITFALMKNPVFLPSGQTIDQSTLNKHLSTQSEWGRPPTDPFTGILFSEKYKPIPNLTLKLKIDKYLMNKSLAPMHGECSQKLQLQAGTEVIRSIYSKKRKLNDDDNENNLNEEQDDHKVTIKGTLDAANTPLSKQRILQIDESPINPLHCSSCTTYFSLLSCQYRLPCQHRLCRSCLLNATSSYSCPACHVTFKHDQVRRTYK